MKTAAESGCFFSSKALQTLEKRNVKKPAGVCLQIVYIPPLTILTLGGKLTLALWESEC